MATIDRRPCKGDLYKTTMADGLGFLECEDCEHYHNKCLGFQGWEWLLAALNTPPEK